MSKSPFKKIEIEIEKVENGFTMESRRDYAERKKRVYFTMEELFDDLSAEIQEAKSNYKSLSPPIEADEPKRIGSTVEPYDEMRDNALTDPIPF